MEKHYDIVRPLGEGGFGVVYMVKRKTDGQVSLSYWEATLSPLVTLMAAR